jgi:hypothetical protein
MYICFRKCKPLFETLRITITILDIIHRPVFYLKHSVSESSFCLRLQAEPIQIGKVHRANLCLSMHMSRIVIVIAILLVCLYIQVLPGDITVTPVSLNFFTFSLSK